MEESDSPTAALNAPSEDAKDDVTEVEVVVESEASDTKHDTEPLKSNDSKSSDEGPTKKPKASKKSGRASKKSVQMAETPATPPPTASRRFGRLAWSPERQQAMKKSLKKAGKKFLVFMISHVGLTCVVIGYSIIGGFIFQVLEATNEKYGRIAIASIRERHVQRLWNVTEALNILYPQKWMNEASVVLREFQRDIYEAVKDKGWDGSDEVNETNLQWTYAGSLLYSVTVITTIGYGHLTPKTTWGRLVTMLYALIGIPLTLQCLSNIGSFMAHCFRLMWKQITCAPCRTRVRRRSMYLAAKRAVMQQHSSRLGHRASLPSLVVTVMEKKPRDGLANGAGDKVKVSSSGEGHDCPTDAAGQDGLTSLRDQSCLLRQCQGQENVAMLSSSVTFGPEVYEPGTPCSGGTLRSERADQFLTSAEMRKAFVDFPPAGYGDLEQLAKHAMVGADFPMSAGPVGYSRSKSLEPDIGYLAEYHEAMLKKTLSTARPPEVVRVPITVCLVIAAVYIFLGAMLFTLWEDSWSYFDSSYFCFVTLSTIGFGDIVPGYDTDSWDNQAKRVSCTLYLLFGLALLAMCFELIQTECRQIFASFARAIGFTNDNGV